MDWTEIAANWPALSGSILTRWPGADEDTILAIDGDRAAFIAYISRLDHIPEAEAEERRRNTTEFQRDPFGWFYKEVFLPMHRDGLAVEQLSPEAQTYYRKQEERGYLKTMWGQATDRYEVLNPPQAM